MQRTLSMNVRSNQPEDEECKEEEVSVDFGDGHEHEVLEP